MNFPREGIFFINILILIKALRLAFIIWIWLLFRLNFSFHWLFWTYFLEFNSTRILLCCKVHKIWFSLSLCIFIGSRECSLSLTFFNNVLNLFAFFNHKFVVIGVVVNYENRLFRFLSYYGLTLKFIVVQAKFKIIRKLRHLDVCD